MRWIAAERRQRRDRSWCPKCAILKQDEGFNAANDTYEDLVKAGVIDPAKVVRSALQNAVVDCVAAADDGGARLRDSRREEGSASDAARRWYGRDVLRLSPRTSRIRKGGFA